MTDPIAAEPRDQLARALAEAADSVHAAGDPMAFVELLRHALADVQALLPEDKAVAVATATLHHSINVGGVCSTSWDKRV